MLPSNPVLPSNTTCYLATCYLVVVCALLSCLHRAGRLIEVEEGVYSDALESLLEVVASRPVHLSHDEIPEDEL